MKHCPLCYGVNTMSEQRAYIERNNRVTEVTANVCSQCGHTVVKDAAQPKILDNRSKKV